MSEEAKVRTCLWFESKGQEAAEFYVSLLPDSKIDSSSAMITQFSLAGAPYLTLNGGPMYKPTAAASIFVSTKDQAETDQLWDALTADGGQEGRCGWLTDKYGLSWQIVPEALGRCLGSDDAQAAQRAQAAMMTMNKIEIEALEVAFAGSQEKA